jgi:hypothetical protein
MNPPREILRLTTLNDLPLTSMTSNNSVADVQVGRRSQVSNAHSAATDTQSEQTAPSCTRRLCLGCSSSAPTPRPGRSTYRAVAKRLDGRDAGAARRQGWGLSTVCTDTLMFAHPTAQARAGAQTRVCSVICATVR